MLTGLVPFFVTDAAPLVIVAIWALATLPCATVVSVVLTVVMGGVAGPGGRFTLMSRRWSILGLTNALTVVIVGQLLTWFEFPLSYQVVFIGSAIGGVHQRGLLHRSLKLLLPQEVPEEQSDLVATLRHGAALRQSALRQFFLAAQFVFRWGMAMAIPLLPLYCQGGVGGPTRRSA